MTKKDRLSLEKLRAAQEKYNSCKTVENAVEVQIAERNFKSWKKENITCVK